MYVFPQQKLRPMDTYLLLIVSLSFDPVSFVSALMELLKLSMKYISKLAINSLIILIATMKDETTLNVVLSIYVNVLDV